MEAGRSLGLSYMQTMRRIIIPQAVKNILPALGNELITLLKETSIVTVIGLRDLTKAAQLVTISATYAPELMPKAREATPTRFRLDLKMTKAMMRSCTIIGVPRMTVV